MNQFMSVTEIDKAQDRLLSFKNHVNRYYDTLSEVILMFKNDSIAQSFFESGAFGQDRLEYLQKIHASLNDFVNTLILSNNSLFVQTQAYFENQRYILSNSNSSNLD